MAARMSRAWLLIPYGVESFAVADHTVMEYLSTVQLHPVPLTPPHCRAAIFWRQRIVPLVDFSALSGQRAVTIPKAVVLAYQTESGAPLVYIAVALREPPVRVSVSDEAACALPLENKALWQKVAVSCFARDGMAIPIVNVARLDSAKLRLYAEAHCPETDPINEDAIAVTDPTAIPTVGTAVEPIKTRGESATAFQSAADEFDEDAEVDSDDAWGENDSEDFGDLEDEEDSAEDTETDDDGWADIEKLDEEDMAVLNDGEDLDLDMDIEADSLWDEDEDEESEEIDGELPNDTEELVGADDDWADTENEQDNSDTISIFRKITPPV